MAESEPLIAEYPVLDDIAVELSREYLRTLAGMNSAIANVLGHARGLSKSEGLYIVEGGLSNDLFKAAKPAAKKRSKMSASEAAQKKKQGPKAPGSRGGKWYRDKHGHIRYGVKAPGDEERDWEPLKEEEVTKLHESLEAVFEYSPKVREEMLNVLGKTGIDGELLLQVFRDSSNVGMSVDDYWLQLATAAGHSDEEAHEALSQVMEGYRSALREPSFRKSAAQAIQKRKLQEQEAHERLARVEKYTEGSFPDLMEGNTRESAIKLLGVLSDLRLLSIPRNYREAAEDTDEGGRAEAKKRVGRIVPNREMLNAVASRLDDFSGVHALAVFAAERMREVNALPGDYKYRDEDGSWSDQILSGGKASAEEVANTSEEAGHQILNGTLFSKYAANIHDTDDLTDSQERKAAQRFNEIISQVHDLVSSYNNDQGGQELGLLFNKTYPVSNLFTDKNALESLDTAVKAKQDLVTNSLTAQENDDFAVPTSILSGLKKMGQQLFSYQKQALNWMSTVKRGILAYDTGMGKTPISITFVAHLRELAEKGKISKEDSRGIMVMPLGLIKQWPNEIRKFYPDAKIVTIGEDLTNVDDRVRVLNAIQRGDIEADFVLMSASTVQFTKETRESFKSSEIFEEHPDSPGEYRKKKGVSEEDFVGALRSAAAEDPLCQALRGLKGCTFFDEAHHESQGLKTSSNVHNAAAQEFLKDRERSFLLTATPMPNGKPGELFEQMDLIHPGSAGPDAKRFENSVATSEMVPDEDGQLVEQPAAMDDWKKFSENIAPYVFRKKKTDADVVAANKAAGRELPPIQGDEGEPGGATHMLRMPESMKLLMDKFAGDIKPHDYDERSKKKGGEGWKPADELGAFAKNLRKLVQQQQMGVTPRLLLGDDPAKWAEYGYDGSQPKIEHLGKLVQRHFANPKNNDKPLIVFSQYPSSFKYAKDHLKSLGVDESLIGEIHGKVNATDRGVVQDAANAGKLKVVFVGTQAGGAGLNLQGASDSMIYLDQPWAPSAKQQALGRVWRTGQKNTVTAINMQLAGSVDEQKLSSLASKQKTIETMFNARAGADAAVSAAVEATQQLLGDVVHMDDSAIDAALEKKGLKGLITPDVLRGKFDKEKFSKTAAWAQAAEFGQQVFETKHVLNDLNLKEGLIDKETHKANSKKYAGAEKEWARTAKRLGKNDVALSTNSQKAVEPEIQYVPAAKFDMKGVKLTPTAKAVLDAAKKQGNLTVGDFVDDHLRDALHTQLAAAEKKGELTPHTRYEIAQQHEESGTVKDVTKHVEAAFQELERYGFFHKKPLKPKSAEDAPLPTKKSPAKKASKK